MKWKSANGKWTVEEDELRHKTDWNNGSSYVAKISATDGWRIAYAVIDVDGTITTGISNTTWEYFVPKTIEAKAFSMLRAMYKAKKPVSKGKAQLPYQYAVIVATRTGKDPKPTFYRTYNTAADHANKIWATMPKTMKDNGAFVNLGRLERSKDSVKDIPERFRYSLLATVNNDRPKLKIRR